MAEITNYSFSGEEVVVPVTLTASDTAIVDLNKKSTLVVSNDTGGNLTVNVKGDTATTVTCTGVGSISLTAGKSFDVDDGETFKFPLNTTYQKWLGDGNLTITGGDAATAYILEV